MWISSIWSVLIGFLRITVNTVVGLKPDFILWWLWGVVQMKVGSFLKQCIHYIIFFLGHTVLIFLNHIFGYPFNDIWKAENIFSILFLNISLYSVMLHIGTVHVIPILPISCTVPMHNVGSVIHALIWHCYIAENMLSELLIRIALKTRGTPVYLFWSVAESKGGESH